MPRLNIEENYWTDPRRVKLILKLGSAAIADGYMLQAWRLAQDHWIPERSLIPHAKWEAAEFPAVIFEIGFAERQEDGVYIRGIEEQCQWWFEAVDYRREAGRTGGRISAQRPRDSKGRLLPRVVQADPSNPSNPSEPKQGPTHPSLSSSSSSSSSRDLSVNTQRSVDVWKDTLKHFGINRNLIAGEDVQIARAVQQYGGDAVSHALLGARFEEETENFSPKKHVSLRRIFDPKLFQKFVNLGAQNRPTERRTHKPEIPVCSTTVPSAKSGSTLPDISARPPRGFPSPGGPDSPT